MAAAALQMVDEPSHRRRVLDASGWMGLGSPLMGWWLRGAMFGEHGGLVVTHYITVDAQPLHVSIDPRLFVCSCVHPPISEVPGGTRMTGAGI